MQVGSPAADWQPSPSVSVLTPSGYQSSTCGYCKSMPRKTRLSIGAIASSLQPSHYQILVDHGWRRSGTYLYKPDCLNSCCPNYTIRLDASAFEPTKDQRKAANRWSKYVLGQDYIHKAARLCPQTREEKTRRRNRFNLSESVHGCEYSEVQRPLDKRTQELLEPAHRFEVTLELDHFTEEKYALYANYQSSVHGESQAEFSKTGFRRFLCAGIRQSHRVISGTHQRLGSYHQCYRLDGRLIALGVLDLLPGCVSSVYLIYHSDFFEWNFGKLSAMREISLALQGGYQYYYLGFYIHSCIKMRYKAQFKPTYVLDLENYTWDLLDSDILHRMSTRKYVSVSRERRFNLPPIISDAFLQSHRANLDPDLFRSLSEYVKPPSQNAGSQPERHRFYSVFEAGTPGVMTLEEVQQKVDLGGWRVKLKRYSNLTLEDLVEWESDDISDPDSIKGMAAELAACIPIELVEQTMIAI